jgi:phosphorylcholine metabolism protein LicD
MTTAFEKVKSYLRNQKIYSTLRKNPILLKMNQHYRRQAEAQKRESVHTYGLESLKLAKEAFHEIKREFWLDWGTLLGAVREKGFIGHDADIDVGTFFIGNEDAKKIEHAMKKRGFTKTREFWLDEKVVEETYVYKGVNLDVFYYYPGKEKDQIHCFACEEGEHRLYEDLSDYTVVTRLTVERITSTLTGTKEIDFKGEKFSIPENEDQYLQGYYGPTYMVKNEKWDWSSKKERDILPYQDNTRAILYKK